MPHSLSQDSNFFRKFSRDCDRSLHQSLTKPLYIVNDDLLAIVRSKFRFDAVQFGFNPIAILGILDSIRGRLSDRIYAIDRGRRKT